MFFKGRSIKVQQDAGNERLLTLVNLLEDHYKADAMPKMEGRKLVITLSPKK